MTALTFKENELHNRLIVAEFNLEQVEEELRRLREENETLRARLAQPEPEPQEAIAKWIKTNTEHREWYICPKCSHQTPRFKDEWQRLTENEIKHLWYEACQTNLELTSQLIVHLARNIEAKLKEKNT